MYTVYIFFSVSIHSNERDTNLKRRIFILYRSIENVYTVFKQLIYVYTAIYTICRNVNNSTWYIDYVFMLRGGIHLQTDN